MSDNPGTLSLSVEKIQRERLVMLEIGGYGSIRQQYKASVAAAITEYLYTEGVKVTRFRNAMKLAIVEAFFPAFETGYEDGGGELPIEADDVDYVNGRVDGEFGFVDDLFNQLKALKKEGPDAFMGEAEARAEGYARTLDGIYNAGRVRGAKNRMLTFGGFDGVESCQTCKRLTGQRHRASWWVNRGLVPYRGNANFECGNWQCEHFLFDDAGEVFTL